MAIGNYDPKKGTLLKRPTSTLANNSGDGPNSPVLDIVAKEFNWGAFCLNWIWGLGNNTYLPLIILITYIIPWIGTIAAIGLAIWFGIKGNTWAWQNKRWESIEHFHAVQKKWAIAGIICASIGVLLAILLACGLLFIGAKAVEMRQEIENTQQLKNKATYLILKSTNTNKSFYLECDGTPEGLASYFAQGLNGSTFSGNNVKAEGYIWFFGGDGACTKPNACWAKVYDRKKEHNTTIPLKLIDGHIMPYPEEID